MKYLLCLIVLFAAACSPATAPYPRDYTGGPPAVVYDLDIKANPTDAPAMPCMGKRTCLLTGKKCCDMPCCKKGCCHGADKPVANPHAGHVMRQPAVGEPVDVYADVMANMHQAMGAYTPTGDADIDFVQGMVPHHQGAVDMAEILLEKGNDPKLRQLARGIIVAQKREIAFMNYWLKTKGATPDSNVSNVNIPR